MKQYLIVWLVVLNALSITLAALSWSAAHRGDEAFRLHLDSLVMMRVLDISRPRRIDYLPGTPREKEIVTAYHAVIDQDEARFEAHLKGYARPFRWLLFSATVQAGVAVAFLLTSVAVILMSSKRQQQLGMTDNRQHHAGG